MSYHRLPHRLLALLPLSALAALGCDAQVVDAVREPPPMEKPPDPPEPPNPLVTSLIHRYSFDGKGTVALDAKGAAHGQVVGTKLTGTGNLVLAGERSGQYVNLPNGLISGLDNATFEVWLTWNGGAAWQRIFDFGTNTTGEDGSGGAGTRYLFLTAAASNDSVRMITPALRVAYSQGGVEDEDVCQGTDPLPIGVATHVALVVDHDHETFALYQDGALLTQCTLKRPLSAIDDVNNWLGHSNFVADADIGASYDEFRVYSAALSAEQLADSFAAGPDAQP